MVFLLLVAILVIALWISGGIIEKSYRGGRDQRRSD
jgi:hypothetical protein